MVIRVVFNRSANGVLDTPWIIESVISVVSHTAKGALQSKSTCLRPPLMPLICNQLFIRLGEHLNMFHLFQLIHISECSTIYPMIPLLATQETVYNSHHL